MLETGEFERVGSSKTRKVDVRMISATNADLAAEVAPGRFRQDLLFRLNTIEIALPPLRDRREDIPLLARHFLRQHAQRYRKPLTGFDPSALQLLARSPLAGQRPRARSRGRARGADGAGQRRAVERPRPARREHAAAGRLEDMSLEDVEAFLIKKAMARYGNVSQAAQALGLSRSALYRRLERYKL